MRVKNISDEQIVKKWKKYCERHHLHYEEPNLPLKRVDDWSICLENEKGHLAQFVGSKYEVCFIINESIMMSFESRFGVIYSLLEDAKDKLESLSNDTDDSELASCIDSASNYVDLAMEDIALFV